MFKVDKNYGIVANSLGFKLFCSGSKVWIIGGWTGGCYERVQILGQAQHKRWIVKWVGVKKLCNVRVAWIPDHITEILDSKDRYHCITGTKREMKKWIKEFLIWNSMRGK